MKPNKLLKYVCYFLCVVGFLFMICFFVTNEKYMVNVSTVLFFVTGILAYIGVGKNLKKNEEESISIKQQNNLYSNDNTFDIHNQEMNQDISCKGNIHEDWMRYYKTKSLLTTLEIIVVFIAIIIYIIASALK